MKRLIGKIDDCIINRLKECGYHQLRDSQYYSILKGLNNNVIISLATGGGKTLVAEVLMMNELINNGGKVLYLAPVKSLTREKYREFKNHWGEKYDIVISTGDYSMSGKELGNADIIVLSYERCDSLLRKNLDWMLDVCCVVIDEIHLIGDKNRGEILEFILTHFKNYAKIVGLSATISNIDDLCGWLNAEKYADDNRINDIKLGIINKGEVKYIDGGNEKVEKKWIDVVINRINNEKKVLIFVNSKSATEKIAKQITECLNDKIDVIWDKISIANEKRFGKELIMKGVLFHNASLSKEQRAFVEEMFNNGDAKCVVATTTLSIGVNTPTDTVIIKDIIKFDDAGEIDVYSDSELKQMVGRAGRYGSGEALIVVNKNANKMLKRLKNLKPESVNSQLILGEKFNNYILTLISYGYGTINELVNYLNDTFFAFQIRNSKYLN